MLNCIPCQIQIFKAYLKKKTTFSDNAILKKLNTLVYFVISLNNCHALKCTEAHVKYLNELELENLNVMCYSI